jgi:hypothetical protein
MRLSALSISLINKDSSLKVVPLGIEGDFVALALRTTAINPPCPPLLKGGDADEVSCRITRPIFLDRGIGQTSVSPPAEPGAYLTELRWGRSLVVHLC